ncbi:F-box only protein 9 [Trichogramma pretiosum]|uniref:F-box only protein 9 n=1 Tax=Trichogramma pretiosum TaxID=7493 RepID=UPI0006C9DD77|nr:F-box only protein 9 [Trichogramma pretiosum]
MSSTTALDDPAAEKDDSSSLQSPDALKTFREEWKRELQSSPKHVQNQKSQSHDSVQKDEDIHEKLQDLLEDTAKEAQAKKLFLLGVEHERTGKLYEAIQFYRRAVQLVPDIEFRIYESTKPKPREEIEPEKQVSSEIIKCDRKSLETQDDSNIFEKFSNDVEKTGQVCLLNNEQEMVHISALPIEIILYIFRWIVSRELDFRSLEKVSQVCKGFYVFSRDVEIWRMACIRVWGVKCGHFEPDYHSWRHMYMQRPRLQYNGCYVSKTTYLRPGENSFQDQFYRPWHVVEYYRYLRFFPEGKVLMLTSTEEPQSCVNSLKSRNPRNPSVLIGHYRLHENRVTLVMKRQGTKNDSNVVYSNRRRKRNEIAHDSGVQTFYLEFEIQTYRKRVNFQLSWLSYSIYTKYKNGDEIPAKMNLGGRYPSFRFGRVKCYTHDSEFPLE